MKYCKPMQTMTYRPDTHALNMATGLSCPGTSRAHRDPTGKKAQGGNTGSAWKRKV